MEPCFPPATRLFGSSFLGKGVFGPAYFLLLFCLECDGQTNTTAPTAIHFSVSPLQLRAEPMATPSKNGQVSTTQPTVSAPAQLALDLSSSDNSPRSRIITSDHFYLTSPTSEPESPSVRFVNSVFTPEVFQFKKVSIKCPIATAIKRKNPLALLSGLAVDPDDGAIAFRILQLEW